MNERTWAVSIPKAVKDKVYERDGGCCILCGKRGLPEAHYIPRSQGGLGIEENIVTLCRECHRRYDETLDREFLKVFIKDYLDLKYPDFPDDKRRYHRWLEIDNEI